MKALIIDDERLARQELRRLLAAHPELEVAGEARTGLEDLPQVIFTTAYDEYALKAFEVSALDYSVKPVAPARLAAAVAKLHPHQARPLLERVFVKDGERCWLVRVADIFLLESEGNYTRLYFADERPLIPRSLSALHKRLDTATFFRAGRKHIVNLKWVERVEPGIGGNLLVILRGGATVEMSRRQSAHFREALSL
jgi:two-component system LytT family response regulator